MATPIQPGHIVSERITERGTTVRICDDALRRMTPEQQLRARRRAQEVAYGIAHRAMLRGRIEGITEEEFRRRYGTTPYEAWAAPLKEVF